LLYILHGADDYSIAHELEGIKQSAGDPALRDTNTVTLDGGEVTVNELRVACETVPFLADKRLVIVYGLMERFAPKQSSRASVRKHDSQLINYEVFGDIIKGIPPSTILVLMENELKDSNPLLRMISVSGQVKAFPLLKAVQLREWITGHVAEEGGNIAPSAITLLTRLIGSNLWFMSSELEKLTLYADGRRIEEKDVKALVSYTQQSNVFAMVDAIVEFNIQKAETMLQQLLSDGSSPTQLLNMLNRQMRLIVRARELKQQKLSEVEMRGRLGLSADWLVRKTLEQANRYTLPRLKQVYQQLLETDIAIKTGKYDGELALNILIAELCQPQKPDSSPRQMHGVAV
jgi:DNA polymerase-3 subunit delta